MPQGIECPERVQRAFGNGDVCTLSVYTVWRDMKVLHITTCHRHILNHVMVPRQQHEYQAQAATLLLILFMQLMPVLNGL